MSRYLQSRKHLAHCLCKNGSSYTGDYFRGFRAFVEFCVSVSREQHSVFSIVDALSSSSPSSTAARFLFLDCLDCFFLSVLASRASFFFGSPWLCSFLSGLASKSSEPAGESALLLCDMFSGLEPPLVPASDTFRNVTISRHPKIASISL